jgi:cell division protein FtsB
MAFGGFVVWMLFFDEKDVFTQQKRASELQKLEDKIEYYQDQITETRNNIDLLDKDPMMLEKFAREKYFMKRPNEDVFIIESPK